MVMLALDIGATKFAAGTVDPDGAVQDVRRIPVPRAEVWDACRDLLTSVAGDAEVTAVGIGAAGPVDVRTGTTGPLNIPEWVHGFELEQAVRKLFPDAIIRSPSTASAWCWPNSVSARRAASRTCWR